MTDDLEDSSSEDDMPSAEPIICENSPWRVLAVAVAKRSWSSEKLLGDASKAPSVPAEISPNPSERSSEPSEVLPGLSETSPGLSEVLPEPFLTPSPPTYSNLRASSRVSPPSSPTHGSSPGHTFPEMQDSMRNESRFRAFSRSPSSRLLRGKHQAQPTQPSRFDGVQETIDKIIELELANRLDADGNQRGSGLIFMHDVEDPFQSSSDEDFDEALLQAVVSPGCAVSLRAKLCLGLDWNKPRIVQQVLNEACKEAQEMYDEQANHSFREMESPLELNICRDLAHALHHAATQLVDTDFDEELVHILLDHPRLRFEFFPFALLRLPNGPLEVSSNRDWCRALHQDLPTGLWNLDSTEQGGALAQRAGGRLGMLELLLWAVLAEKDRLAQLLWQHSEEPLRYALMVSQLYAHMAASEKTQSSQRQKLAQSKQFEDWAVDMLTACREEVAIQLLESDMEGRWSLRLLELAISGGSKRFVAHEFCGELLDRRWRGDTLDSDVVMPRSATAYHAFLYVVDHLLRKLEARLRRIMTTEGGSARASPTMNSRKSSRLWIRQYSQDLSWQVQQQASQNQPKVANVLRVPFVKFFLRTLLELLFLFVYAIVLLQGPTRSTFFIPRTMEMLLYLWGWALILDEYYQFCTVSHSLAEHFGSLWNRIDLLIMASIAMASGLHLFIAIPMSVLLSTGSGFQALALSRIILAFGALPSFTRSFAAISLDQKYGVLFLSCARMFGDIKRFMVLLGIVMLAFGLTFSGLASANIILLNYSSRSSDTLISGAAPADQTPVDAIPPSMNTQFEPAMSSMHAFLLALWAIHGQMIGHEVHEMPRIATVLLWVYFMLSQIVLVNLLVAIMGDTWQQIRENADDEWKYLKVNAIAEYFELHYIPPPFNAVWLLRALFDGSFGANTDESCLLCTRPRSVTDVKKLSKLAQREVLKAWRQQSDMESISQLRALQATQHKMFEKLEMLSAQVSEGLAESIACD